MNNASFMFREALQKQFGFLNWLPVPDGVIHRFCVPGDRPWTANGWYVLHADGIASGAFGNWKTGCSRKWSARTPASPFEAELMARRLERAKQQRESDLRRKQDATSELAERIWSQAKLADSRHPYLVQKSIERYQLRQFGSALLVPMFDCDLLMNLQRIYPNGSKRFLSGGKVKGCYSLIGNPEPGKQLYVAEGWATGATLHAHTGVSVACAMNAGNLLNAGYQIQQFYPDSELIIAGDNDRQTEADGKGNPGVESAIKAANSLGCSFVLPEFPLDAPLELTDFNDLACWRAAQ